MSNIIEERKEVINGKEVTVKVIKAGAKKVNEGKKEPKKPTYKMSSNKKALLNNLLKVLINEGEVYKDKSKYLLVRNNKQFEISVCECKKNREITGLEKIGGNNSV